MVFASFLRLMLSRFALSAAICWFATFAQAQTADTFSIKATGIYDGNHVVLRWAPKNFATWNWANFNLGYDIERTTLKLNGIPLTTDSMLASQVIIATSLKPLPEMQWESMPDSNLAGIVAGCIYGDSIEVVDLGDADFMTVVNTTEARQNRFGFSLFACDQNFDIALAAGLAWVDTTVVEDANYIYVVKLHSLSNGATEEKGVAFLNTIATSIPPSPKPIAIGANKAVILSWPKQADYGSYMLERSSDNGLTYTVLNTKPFVSLSTLNTGDELNTYIDSLPSNGVTYIYRVRGMTPFGITGPPSDTVHSAGIPTPIATEPYIKKVAESQSGQMQIDWEFPSDLEAQILQFELHRASTIDGDFQLLATAPPNERTYMDNAPEASNYYILKVKDLNGNYASSLPKFGQTDDEDAPEAPIGLTGSCDPTGQVTISWRPNLESDLLGYRVYTSDQNIVDSAFAQITSNPVRDTFFRYQVDLNSLTEQMFFSVKAVDFRENTSAPSAYLNIQRVDIIAPSAPSITDVIPRLEGVYLEVSLSSSNDVVRYEFQKRWEGSPDWIKLATFSVDSMVTNYMDVLTYVDPVLRRRWYYYRLVAIDDEGLESSSQMIRTKPLDQGMRGPIQNLVAALMPGVPKRAQLTWTYPPDVDLVGFQIYRAIDNSQMRSLKFIASANPIFSGGNYMYIDSDTNLKNIPQRAIFVQPPAVPGGPTNTVVAAVVNKPANVAPNAFITLKYQVMAVYQDGAQSPMSGIVQVIFQ